METIRPRHTGQPQRPRQSETVRRALGGAVEFRHFAGFDQPFAPHAHDYPVIGLVRKGRRVMECNQRRYRLGPGQLLALNAGDAHGCIQDGTVPLVYDSLALLALPDCPPLAGPLVENAEAIALMEDAVGLFKAPVVDEERLEEAIYLLVGSLAAADRPEHRNDAACAVAAYLRCHASEKVRLEEAAAAAGLDKYRALRSFTASFGLTPMRYLTSLRVESARMALVAGASCAEAASKAGFADQAHMTRAFKERLGMTPGFYRRAIVGTGHDTAAGARAARPEGAPSSRLEGAPSSPETPGSSRVSLPGQVRS